MDKTLELMLIVISAVFVLYTAAADPAASLIVALVAIICLVAYRMMFGKMGKKKTVKHAKKVTAKKKTIRKKK